MNEKNRYAKVSLYCRITLQGSCVVEPRDVPDTIGNVGEMSIGDSWRIEPVDMTEAEFKALPEFGGW